MKALDLINTGIALARPAIAGYGSATARKFGIAIMAGLGGFIAAIAVSGFLLLALWEYVRPLVGPIGAPLILAAAIAVFAGIMALIVIKALRPKQLRTASRPLNSQPEALLLEVENLIRKQKMPVLLGAVLVGILAGSQRR